MNEIDTSELDLSDIESTLCAERSKVIEEPKRSEVADYWAKARTQYAGHDELHKGYYQKSSTLDGPLITIQTDGTGKGLVGSTVFVNITRPYTNAAAARIADIILPAGNKANWDLGVTPTSESELIKPYLSAIEGLPEALAQIAPKTIQRLINDPEIQAQAIARCKERIEDNLQEAKWYAETRKQIREACITGSGVLKGLFPAKRKISDETRQLIDAIPIAASMLGASPEELTLLSERLKKEILWRPNVQQIPVENLYPDYPACGDDIHNGSFLWEEIPNKSKDSIRELLDDPSYLPDAIAEVLSEGPKNVKGKSGSDPKSFTIWLRTGSINGVWSQAEFINDKLVKISLPPLSNKRFPYHVLSYEARDNSWAGIGVPEQIEVPQRGVNSSVRAMQNNMAWSVGPQVLIREGLIEPMPGDDWQLHPYKMWRVTEAAMNQLFTQGKDAEEAIKFLKFESFLNEILPVVQFWLQMAEQTTGLPLLLQGQKSSDSVGVTQTLMNSSTTNLRLLVKQWDDNCCVPIIDDFYLWEQTYGPEEVQADAVAQAKGSTILVEKELAQQAYVQLLDRSIQPAFGMSPMKIAQKFVESMHVPWEEIELSDEERQHLEAAEQQPEAAVQVAQIRAQTDLQIQEMRGQIEEVKVMLDARLKGLQLDQSQLAIETQGQANIMQEQIRQDGSLVKEAIKPQSQGAQEAQPPAPPSPDIDEALNVLGL
jgi:hypothetical protein